MSDPDGLAGAAVTPTKHRNVVRRGLHKVHKYWNGPPSQETLAHSSSNPAISGSATAADRLPTNSEATHQEPTAAHVSVPSSPAIPVSPFQTTQHAGSPAAAPAPAAPAVPATKSSVADILNEEPKPEIGHWASFRHVNGVAIFQENSNAEGEGGALMVSAVMRAPPATVFRTLMAVDNRGKERLPLKFRTRLLQKIDDHNRILQGFIVPSSGLGSLMCAPREVVLQQSWREDEAGTFIVLFQSVTHPDAPEQGRPWYRWHAPIRSKTMTAGWTIAPLKPALVRGEESQECLVTYIVKIDLGGWLVSPEALGMLPQFVQDRYNSFATFTFLDPVLLSIMTLREKVEQDRFVVRPWELGQQADPTAARGSPIARRASMLSRMSSVRGGRSEAQGALSVASSVPPTAELVVSAPPKKPHGMLDRKFWSCPGSAGFKVRGRNYLRDRKKVLADEPVFELASVDLIILDAPSIGVARHLDSVRKSSAPFTFVVQIMIPGPPYVSLVISWAGSADPATLTDQLANGRAEDSEYSAFDAALARFLAGDSPADDARRNSVFKLIPSVAEGSWIIKQSVGNTPVLLGQKLTTTYTREKRWFEVDVDVGSSSAASLVVNHVKGATKHLVIDMAVLLEGQTEAELPEALLGSVRLDHLDMSQAVHLDTTGNKVPST
ncbi:hypothetical protein WJX72_006118 [[Myrmecia] bisecta]|uniref:START domain-containing protein n=1 Tax=[Myrmecia] bisecta TaxID=41462 RepID=A0AAW1PLL4_9CHLO